MASGKKIVIYSTSDGQEGSLYDKMLDETSKLNQYYADKYSHTYKTFKGIKWGTGAPDSMFNRLFLAVEEAESAEFDWLIYLDADSYIVHMDDDFIDLLIETYPDKMLLRAQQGRSIWGWNTPLFVNLKHEVTLKLFKGWTEVVSYNDSVLFSLLDIKERIEAGKTEDQALNELLLDPDITSFIEENDPQINWDYFRSNTELIPSEYIYGQTSKFIRHWNSLDDITFRYDQMKVDIETVSLLLGL